MSTGRVNKEVVSAGEGGIRRHVRGMLEEGDFLDPRMGAATSGSECILKFTKLAWLYRPPVPGYF